MSNVMDENLAAKVDFKLKHKRRNLELLGYAGFVTALVAQGDLTKEKKKVLQDVASALGIPLERYQAEIRRAVSDIRTKVIAMRFNGPNVDSAWRQEGRRLVPIIPRAIPQTVFTQIADNVARLQYARNRRLDQIREAQLKDMSSKSKKKQKKRKAAHGTTSSEPPRKLAATETLTANSTATHSSAIVEISSSAVVAIPSSAVAAIQPSAVTATQSSTVAATQSSTVAATQSSTVAATQSSAVAATQSSVVEVTQSSVVEATQSSTVAATPSSAVTTDLSIVAAGPSAVIAGPSAVRAGPSTVRAGPSKLATHLSATAKFKAPRQSKAPPHASVAVSSYGNIPNIMKFPPLLPQYLLHSVSFIDTLLQMKTKRATGSIFTTAPSGSVASTSISSASKPIDLDESCIQELPSVSTVTPTSSTALASACESVSITSNTASVSLVTTTAPSALVAAYINAQVPTPFTVPLSPSASSSRAKQKSSAKFPAKSRISAGRGTHSLPLVCSRPPQAILPSPTSPMIFPQMHKNVPLKTGMLAPKVTSCNVTSAPQISAVSYSVPDTPKLFSLPSTSKTVPQLAAIQKCVASSVEQSFSTTVPAVASKTVPFKNINIPTVSGPQIGSRTSSSTTAQQPTGFKCSTVVDITGSPVPIAKQEISPVISVSKSSPLIKTVPTRVLAPGKPTPKLFCCQPKTASTVTVTTATSAGSFKPLQYHNGSGLKVISPAPPGIARIAPKLIAPFSTKFVNPCATGTTTTPKIVNLPHSMNPRLTAAKITVPYITAAPPILRAPIPPTPKPNVIVVHKAPIWPPSPSPPVMMPSLSSVTERKPSSFSMRVLTDCATRVAKEGMKRDLLETKYQKGSTIPGKGSTTTAHSTVKETAESGKEVIAEHLSISNEDKSSKFMDKSSITKERLNVSSCNDKTLNMFSKPSACRPVFVDLDETSSSLRDIDLSQSQEEGLIIEYN